MRDFGISFVHIDESENRRSPYEDDGDEQEDDNDTNITDDEAIDEENGRDKTVEVPRIFLFRSHFICIFILFFFFFFSPHRITITK